MKQHLLIAIASLGLTSVRCFAREPLAPPSPTGPASHANYSVTRNDKELENVFVGHYGETLRLYSDWTAEAVMRGPMEVVYFRSKTDPPASQWPSDVKLDGPDATVTFHPPPFKIKPEDFTPGNMARLRLMQLIVVPKNIPEGFRSLKKLREAKSQELAATGYTYKLQQVGESPWPPDSFWVSISTPYRLFQLYTQSDKNFFIVTSGASPYDEKSDDPVLGSATSRLCSSLSTHLDYFSDKLAAEKHFIYDLRVTLLPWGAVCALSALLSFLPKNNIWLSRLRLIGRMMFSFTTAGLFLAGPMLFASWRLGFDRVVNEASILTCAAILMPWICKFVSTRLGNPEARRVFVWSAIANILPASAGVWGMQDFLVGTAVITDYQDFFALTFIIAVLGSLNGVVFALTHRTGKTSFSGRPS